MPDTSSSSSATHKRCWPPDCSVSTTRTALGPSAAHAPGAGRASDNEPPRGNVAAATLSVRIRSARLGLGWLEVGGDRVVWTFDEAEDRADGCTDVGIAL